MSGPWEKYGAAPEAAPGPWAKYGSSAEMRARGLESPDPTFANAQANPNNPGMVEGMARSGYQGITAGFGDEIVAAGSGAVSALRGDGFREGYDRTLESERAQLGAFRDAHPVAAYGSEIAGSFVLPGASYKSGASLGMNALRGAATGGATGAAYGYGAGEGGVVPRMQSAAVGGAVGGAVGAAAPFILRGVQKIADKRATRKAIDVAADNAPEPASLARQSGELYKAARGKGVVIKQEAVQPLLDDLTGLEKLDTDFTPDSIKVIGRLNEKLGAGYLPLDEIEALHRKAGMAVNKNRIANPQDAAAAGDIARKVDEFMMNLPDEAILGNSAGKDEAIETFRQARQLWKHFRNSEKLQEIVAKSEIAENPAGAIRSGFRAILNKKNKRATYSAAEIQVMRQVISDSKAGNWVQRMIGYGTGLSRQVAATTAGYGLGGPIGAALGSAAATKIGSMAKEAAGEAAQSAADRAARFAATGGQYAQPAPQMLPGFENALRIGQRPLAPAAVNLWNR